MRTRSREIAQLIQCLSGLFRRRTQVEVIILLLCDGKTHKEIGERDGVTRWASMKRIQRARRDARMNGVEIPVPRRGYKKTTLAEIRRRAA